MIVAFQGEPGAFSQEAIAGFFGPVETLPCESFEAVFAAVTSTQSNAGMIPIENSLAGSIHQNYDLLQRYSLWITGEYFLRVRHCLIALPGVQKSALRRVISHPQALGQCDGYLRNLKGIKAEAVFDTAGGVKMLRESGDRACAAIASCQAAEIYAMQILEEGVEDDPENFTRFLAVGLAPVSPSGDAKTSIVFSLHNRPGSLFKALSVFALRDIDLTKIESRPLVGKPWDYLFYVDFAGAAEEEVARKALDHLGEYASMLRVLGSYPRYRPEGKSLS
jgi:prephenate dehydratase